MNSEILLKNNFEEVKQRQSESFCSIFLQSEISKRFIFGRNVYAKSILKSIEINAFVDDFYNEKVYDGIQVIKTIDLPKDALVVVASGGRTKTICNKLERLGISHIDYFAFLKHSNLNGLNDVVFNENFTSIFYKNKSRFENLYNLFFDDLSRNIYSKILTFRLKLNSDFLEGFEFKEDKQYFEEFLDLKYDNESFIDVGMFDGFTSSEFIKKCPNFKFIYGFEPGKSNFDKCMNVFKEYSNVEIFNSGLSNRNQLLKFTELGSESKIDEFGEIEIKVDKLDNFNIQSATFIKIDIEGGEKEALEGAKNTILKYHPRLAVAVYHNPLDFIEIPELVLSIRSDYDIYLRHYTETIYETIMFFIPKKSI
jgi:FkbM family methyltransferase